MILNERQLEAVNYLEGPLLILAGAGAGKTKTITERVVNIVKSGVEPKNILCVTFTNKAAHEMSERILARLVEEKLIENYTPNLWLNKNLPTIKTFHSLGLSILREFGRSLKLNKNLVVLSPSDVNQLLKEILVKLSLDPKVHDVSKIRNAISREKSANQAPEDYVKKIVNYNMEVIEKVWRNYEQELKARGAVDFDDLIIKPVELLKENSEISKFYQEKFKYIHIDEYQDTNNAQYELIRHLLNPKQKNICVVGDIDQNIYSWRGANLKNILNFEKDFPTGKVVLLEENYRSTQNILNLANLSIAKNKARFPKNLFTQKALGEEIEVCPSFDEKSEAQFVTQKIKELVDKEQVELKNIAVLYRTNFQSRILEEAFLKANLPYNLLGVKFFERKEIRDVLSYLKASHNRDNLSDLKRVLETPKRGIGKASLIKIFAKDRESLSAKVKSNLKNTFDFLDKIRDLIEENKEALSKIILRIIKESGIEAELLSSALSEDKERLENIQELVTLTKRFDALLASQAYEIFLDESSLRSDQDDDEVSKNGVRLMTIHAAKGLEFDYIFLLGLEEDLFPHLDIGNRKKSQEEQEEERRLFYVAVTRAKKKLYLSYTEMRTIYGEKKINLPSEFLEDINDLPDSAVIYHDIYYANLLENHRKSKRNLLGFSDLDDEYEEDFLEV